MLYTIALWWPPASGPGAGTAATTGRLFLTTSWGQPTSTARLYRRYSGQRRAAQKAIDTLSVAWLRGGFGRGAGASSAGFLHHMDWLKHVYTKVGPSGVPPLVHRALSRECSRAPVGHCLAGWGMAPKTLS